MGQLEKYGLYVLCLVIFLILGVTIWGGGELPPTAKRTGPGPGSELNANARNTTSNPSAGGASNLVRPANPPSTSDVLSLLQPVAPPTDPKKNDVKASEASAQKPNGETAKGTDPTKSGSKPAIADAPKPPVDATRPTHKIARGETFDSIAKEKLGSSSLRTEIARLNPKVDPGKLQVGQELVLPNATEIAAIAAKSKPAPKAATTNEPVASAEKKPAGEAGTYTIAKGDTFETIARRELGSSKRVGELKELNSDVDPTRLRIGMQIRLPKK